MRGLRKSCTSAVCSDRVPIDKIYTERESLSLHIRKEEACLLGDGIPLQENDLVEDVRQDSGGCQACQSSANNYCPATGPALLYCTAIRNCHLGFYGGTLTLCCERRTPSSGLHVPCYMSEDATK